MSDQERFEQYMQNLSEIGLSEKHAKSAQDFWKKLNSLFFDVPLPICGPGGELGFQFCWKDKTIYFEIDVAEDSSFEWFFRDDVTDRVEGTEEDAITWDRVPEEFSQCFLLMMHSRLNSGDIHTGKITLDSSSENEYTNK